MSRIFGGLSLGTLAALSAITSGFIGAPAAAEPTQQEIRISYQPAFWALPWFIANDKGWWAKVGLKPTLISFAAGAPQIAAGASDAWDMGGAGDIPAILGAAKYGLLNVAISDFEPAILTIVAGSAKAAETYKKDPKLLAGKEIPATLNSNGERVAVACLTKMGAPADSYRLLNLAPADINAAMLSGRFDLASVWAPNTYILAKAMGAVVVCRGSETNIKATGRLFVTPGFAKNHPDAVARSLALYFHAIEWERSHPKETLVYLAKFYDTVGIKVPSENLTDEVVDHPHPNLQEQLKLFARSKSGESSVDAWSNDVAQFLVDKGSVATRPAATSYVTDDYLKMITKDKDLMKFATEGAD
jgi:NitT/TauT family transport system substrate-binding protein